MKVPGRNKYFALLLVIIFSQAVFGAHAATHLAQDATNCSVCAGHANPEHALPPELTITIEPTVFQFDSRYSCELIAEARAIPYRQRGPPC